MSRRRRCALRCVQVGFKRQAGFPVPAGFERWTIEAGTWAVFQCIGRDEDNIIGETWGKIFREFLPQSGYEMLDRADLEVYGDGLGEGVFCEIWIPVRKRA